MKITVTSTKDFERKHIEKANNDKHELIWMEGRLNRKTVDDLKKCDAILSFTTDEITGDVLDKLKEKEIRYITTRSAGTDHIDVEHAKEIGLKVANAPKYSPYSVAEHAVGMLLTLNRKYIEANRKIQRENFDLNGLIGFDIHGKKAGILGTGKIGEVTAKILNGFGCELLLYDKYPKEELEEKYSARYVELEELLKNSDIIIIHLPLNKETKHLINRESINKMKEGVILINVGRGAIINTNDLIEALKSGKIGKAGLDVYEKEKGLFFDDRSDEPLKDEDFAYLQASNDVLITGHQAFATETAIGNMAEISFQNLNSWEKGEEPENEL